jgi:hypothetical protein
MVPPSPAYDCPPPHAISARRIIRSMLFAGFAILKVIFNMFFATGQR